VPESDESIREHVSAADLLAPKPDDPDLPRGAELRALEAEVEAWLEARPTGLGLSEAVREDRGGR
jgi:hypothetical protein